MIEASGQHDGPAYLCDRCEWAPELCTCRYVTVSGRQLISRRERRRPGDDVDREWQTERAHTRRRNQLKVRTEVIRSRQLCSA